jgi:hypothetical protein
LDLQQQKDFCRQNFEEFDSVEADESQNVRNCDLVLSELVLQLIFAYLMMRKSLSSSTEDRVVDGWDDTQTEARKVFEDQWV